MIIPPNLIYEIRDGKVALLLGAGASLNAKNSQGQSPPSSDELGARLSARFLGNRHLNRSLAQIAEFCLSECGDILTFQEFLRGIFEDFKPTDAHKKLAEFRWWGLATTNYDRLIEQAYESRTQRIQKIVPIIDQNDRVGEAARSSSDLVLVKLHGCISRTANTNSPLIITPDQYLKYRQGREQLFRIFAEWAAEHPIVYIGHSLVDSDINAVLHEVEKLTTSRPRHFLVMPGADDILVRHYEEKRVTVLHGTFEEFISTIDNEVPTSFRGLQIPRSASELPIFERFTNRNVVLSSNCNQFLENDIEYVKGLNDSKIVPASDFYKGLSSGWSAIEQNLDVYRPIADTILREHFLKESNDSQQMEFILIKAHAGAGKTTFLRRLAWNAAHELQRLCLFIKPQGLINSAALAEIIRNSNERVYLFVDDVADRVKELSNLSRSIGEEGKLLTVIGAERNNEWNESCEQIAPIVTAENELLYLNSQEIDQLLSLLEKHKTLGTLATLSLADRKAAFAQVAGRQLLVALYEATTGERFEDIIADEYSNIQSVQAQRLYLTICVLNRMDVPVRAGVISRIHGVNFDEFEKKLFKPLEHIVHTEFRHNIKDYVYMARHPHIAEMVFYKILKSQEDKFDQYIRCLRGLVLNYTTDYKAFRRMVRAKPLMEIFTDHELVTLIYAEAEKMVGEDAFLLHQKGLYEMNRANGNLRESSVLLNRACEIADSASFRRVIRHSVAELDLRKSKLATNRLEKEKYLKSASRIADSLKRDSNDSYGYHTAIRSNISRLEYLISTGEDEVILQEIEKQIETDLSNGLQKFPGDSYLLQTESEFANLLQDFDRSYQALELAFRGNPRNVSITLHLVKQ